MRHLLGTAALAAGALLALAGPGRGADLSHQDAIELSVELGTKDGELQFTPNELTLEAGKLYKLELENPSDAKHYFSAPGFAAAAWTRKVEAGGAEIKGAVREIELVPGGEAEWFFVPVQAGTYALECTIPGHAEGGMTGTVIVR